MFCVSDKPFCSYIKLALPSIARAFLCKVKLVRSVGDFIYLRKHLFGCLSQSKLPLFVQVYFPVVRFSKLHHASTRLRRLSDIPLLLRGFYSVKPGRWTVVLIYSDTAMPVDLLFIQAKQTEGGRTDRFAYSALIVKKASSGVFGG